MTTWTVTDSRGKRHEVTAEKMEFIGKNVILRNAGSPFSENVAVFCDPVAIVPGSDSCGKEELIRPLALILHKWRKYT
jgi:hypothetical protein